MTQKIYTNLEEAVNNYGLAFEVEKVPLFTNKGGLHRLGGKMATMRTDTKEVLGVVSERYPQINPIDKFREFDSFAKEGIIEFVDGGTYGTNGSRIYLQARIPNSINVNPSVGDVIEKRITFYSSYDGTLSNEVANSPLRLVCSNGMTRSEKEWTMKFRNSKNAAAKFEEVALMIEAAVAEYRNFDEFIQATLNTKEYNENELRRFAELVLPAKEEGKVSPRLRNRREALLESIHTGIGQDVIQKMNSYKLMQGALVFTNHVLTENVEDSFEYVNFGGGAKINSRVMALIEESLNNSSVFAN